MRHCRRASLLAFLLVSAGACASSPPPRVSPSPATAATAHPEPIPPTIASPPARPIDGYPPDPGAGPAPYGYPPPYPPPYAPPPEAAPPQDPPATLPYTEGAPVPVGYHVEKRIQRRLVLWGTIISASMYTFTAIGVSTVLLDGENNARDRELVPALIPLAGPFIALGTMSEKKAIPGVVINGLVQAGGISMMIVGLVARDTILVRNELGRAHPHQPEVLVGFKAASLRWRF